METDQQLEKAIQEGFRAKQFLEDETFKKAVETVRERCVTEWRESAPNDVTKRETCFGLLRAVDVLVGTIQTTASNGTVAQAKRDRQQRRG